MHNNSFTTYAEERKRLSARSVQIYDFLKHNAPAAYTDRELMALLCFSERGMIQPRISELINKHKLVEEAYSIKCPTTGKTVRRVRAITGQPTQIKMGI